MHCTACGNDDVQWDNSSAVCSSCGLVIAESQIVSDVTFAETATGAATVQGAYLGNDQTHIRSSNPRFRTNGAGESREQTVNRAREAIERMGRANRIAGHIRGKALRWFQLALSGGTLGNRESEDQPRNFVLGRKQEYTVAACLYVACRQQKTSHMLVDLADTMNINVFVLGRHYLKLLRALNMQLDAVDPSLYIIRFATLLHFGDETNKVAADATKLCKRFDQDWISKGRRPAGVAGAALLLAARMNNFRRSMNEIVQVVKMADVTIRQRLEEFKRTPTAQLSVADFQSVWLEASHDPPSFYRPAEVDREKEEKRKAKEERLRIKAEKAALRRVKGDDEAGDEADDEDAGDDSDAENQQPPQIDPSLDAQVDGAITEEVSRWTNEPAFRQLDQELEQRNLESQKRAMKGGSAVVGLPDISLGVERHVRESDEEDGEGGSGNDNGQEANDRLTADELRAQDGAGEEQSAHGVKESSTQQERDDEALLRTDEQIAPEAGPSRPSPPIKRSRSQSHPSAISRPVVEDTLSGLDEDELDQFILGPEEVRIKERVWMEFNVDYLQAALKRQMKEEADAKDGIKRKPTSRRGGPAKPRDSATAHGENAAESTRSMLAKKQYAKSKKLNYDLLGGLDGFFDVGASAGMNGRSGKRKHGKRKGARPPATTSEDDTTDAEVRNAQRYFDDDDQLEVVEEPGDALPSNHPLRRQKSREERLRASKRKKLQGNSRKGATRAGGAGSGVTSTDESSATELGTQYGGQEDDDDEEEEEDAVGPQGKRTKRRTTRGDTVTDPSDGGETDRGGGASDFMDEQQRTISNQMAAYYSQGAGGDGDGEGDGYDEY
ncbi:unnamed protein product [Jaminaea pallidilutea]